MDEVQGIQGGFVIKKGGDALVPEPAERFIVEGAPETLHKAVQGAAFGQSGQIQMGVLLEKILKNTQIQVRGPAGSGVPETFFQNIDLKVHKIKIQEFPLAYGGEPVKAGIVPVKGEP